MGDYAHNFADEIIKELEKEIASVYKDASAEMQETVEEYFDSFRAIDKQQKALVDSGKLSETDYKSWRENAIARGNKYQQMANNLSAQITNANEIAVDYINGAMPSVYSTSRNYSAYTIEQVDSSADFNLWDENTVRRLFTDHSSLMPSYPQEKAVARGIDLAYGQQQIHASILSSILQGKSISQMANDLMNRIRNMSLSSAIRTARTAVTEAENAGRQDCYDEAEDMGIEMQKQWLATLDERTRPDHAAADGQTVGVDEPFEVGPDKLLYPGDPDGSPGEIYNCRCTTIAKLKDVDEGDVYRYNKDESYEEWLKRKQEEAEGYKALFSEEDYDTLGEAFDAWDKLESKNITDEEKSLIESGYIGTTKSYYLNDLLRKYPDMSIDDIYLKSGEMGLDQYDTAKTLENVISKNTLGKDAVLTRYLDDKAIKDIFGIDTSIYDQFESRNLDPNTVFSDLIGGTVQENGFVSVSGDKELNVFAGRRSNRIDISASAGTNAYITGNYDESEVILGRGTKYEVTGFDLEYDEDMGSCFVIKARIV